jgi:WD40 repeat protein
VAFSPDGKLLAAGGIVAEGYDKTSGMLLVWDAGTGALLLNRAFPTAVTSVAFSPDGSTLASGEHERGVTLWDPHTLKEKCKLDPFGPHSETKGVVRVTFSPTGNLLAIAANHAEQGGFVTVWALDSAGK